MAVYKRGKSKYYWTAFRFRGQRIQQSTLETSIVKAREFETNLRAQLNLGRIGVEDLASKATPLLFKDAVASFFESLDDVKPSTRSRYETAAKPLLAAFGDRPIDKIDAAAAVKYRKDRRNEKCKAPARLLKKNPKAKTSKLISPATVNREMTVLAMVYKHLRTVHKINLASPTADINQLQENNISDRLIESDEFIKYLRKARQPLRDVARLMYYCGLRPGEVLALSVNDIHFKAGVITVRQGKTNSARRRIPLQKNALHILQRRCRAAVDGFLFHGRNKRKGQTKAAPIVKLNKAHDEAIQASGIEPFRLYDCRHAWATHAHAAGIDLESLRVLGGWANLAMLKRYVKPTDDKKAAEIRKLDEYRGNVVPFAKRAAA